MGGYSMIYLLIVCGVCFELIVLITMLSLSLLDCLGRLCFLIVAIPDMHISLFTETRAPGVKSARTK
jgi:hypothetical protein